MRLWSLAESKIVHEFTIAGVSTLTSSPDGRQLAAGCGDGAVRVWDIETGKQSSELRGDVESSKHMATLDWEIAAQGLEIAFHTKEVARMEAENKALEELLKKANETIANVKKILPEKQKAVPPATEAKVAAQKAADDAAAALIAKAPEGKPDAALEKQNKEAQDKLMAAIMAETAALDAVTAAENHIKDAEAEVERITAHKTRNESGITAANAAIAAAKQAQSKATADLAAAKQAVAKGGAKPLAVAFSADAQSVAALCGDGTERVWAIASGLPIEQGVRQPAPRRQGRLSQAPMAASSPAPRMAPRPAAARPRIGFWSACSARRKNRRAVCRSRECRALQPGWPDARRRWR